MAMNLTAELEALENAQFVRRLAEPELAYIFKHALTQAAAYQSLLQRTRREIHHRVAKTIEELYPDRLDEYAALLAQHYAMAGEAEKAIQYLTRAGERALRISAYAEANSAFERACGMVSEEDVARRAWLLVRRGEVHLHWSNYADADQLMQEALALAKESGDARTAATALCGLMRIASQQGAHAEAQRLGEEAVKWAREANAPAALALALRRLGIANNYEGNNELAARQLGESLVIYRELGDLEGIAGCLNSLGIIAREQGDLEQAVAYFHEALALSRKIGDRYAVSIRLINLGVIANEKGDLAEAVRYQQEALALAQEIGDREGAALITLNLGGLALKQGDPSVAMEHYRTALAETMALQSYALALYIVAAVAEAQVTMGRYEYGAELLGLAFGHPAGTADTKQDFAKTLDALRAALPADELAAAMERGKAMNLEAVAAQIVGKVV